MSVQTIVKNTIVIDHNTNPLQTMLNPIHIPTTIMKHQLRLAMMLLNQCSMLENHIIPQLRPQFMKLQSTLSKHQHTKHQLMALHHTSPRHHLMDPIHILPRHKRMALHHTPPKHHLMDLIHTPPKHHHMYLIHTPPRQQRMGQL